VWSRAFLSRTGTYETLSFVNTVLLGGAGVGNFFYKYPPQCRGPLLGFCAEELPAARVLIGFGLSPFTPGGVSLIVLFDFGSWWMRFL